MYIIRFMYITEYAYVIHEDSFSLDMTQVFDQAAELVPSYLVT